MSNAFCSFFDTFNSCSSSSFDLRVTSSSLFASALSRAVDALDALGKADALEVDGPAKMPDTLNTFSLHSEVRDCRRDMDSDLEVLRFFALGPSISTTTVDFCVAVKKIIQQRPMATNGAIKKLA